MPDNDAPEPAHPGPDAFASQPDGLARPLGGLEREHQLLGRLQLSTQLPPEVTLCVLDALVLWQEHGRPWPVESPLPTGTDHALLLREVAARIRERADLTSGLAGLELCRVVRLLDRALLTLDDPAGAQRMRGQEALLRNPDLAQLYEP